MPAAYFYSSTAGSYVLTGAVTNSSTILVLNTVTGLPTSVPFKMVIEPGQPTEEIVKVTAVAGSSLTVTRGWDGSSAVAHAAAVEVRHMMTAEDLSLSRAHEAATAAHGATGAVVGTTNAQQLTNKDLSSGTNSFPASLATTTTTQTLSGKTLSGSVNTFSNIPQSAVTGLTSAFSDKAQSRLMSRDVGLTVPAATNTHIASFNVGISTVGNIGYSLGVFTPTVAGVYAISCTVKWLAFAGSPTSISRRRVYLQVNGTDIEDGINDIMASTTDSLNADATNSVTTQVSLAAGDAVRAYVYQSTGTTLSLAPGARFSITRIA